MAPSARTCEHCGAELQANTYFCGECGKPVAPSTKPAAATKHTIMGGPQVVPPARPPAEEIDRSSDAGIVQPPRGAMGRTMLGIPQSSRPPPPGDEPSPGRGTMPSLGGASGNTAPARTGAQKASARTMVGMPNLGAMTPQATPSAGGAVPLSDPRSAQTLVGAPEVRPFDDTDPVRPSASGGSGDRTLMGLTDDAPAADEARAPVQDRQSGSTRSSQSGARGSRPSGAGRSSAYSMPAGVRRGRSPLVFALAALALIAAAALAYLGLRGERSSGVRVRVASEPEGESMVFEVPGAAQGTKLRFGGQEKPLAAGRASFALAPDSLRVGKNVVPYDLVRAGGEIESGKIALTVDYRVTLDTAPLRAGKAAVDVVVSALPGSKVWLDGQPVTLDAQGRAVRNDPLKLGAGSGRIEHVVHYRVQPPSGETSVGELRTSIPVTTMEIDKPGVEVITDSSTIEIAGAVDRGASLTIDGKPVEVDGGRFLHRYPLPKPGKYAPQIVASSEGKAPHVLQISVDRVPDLAKAAQGFTVDPELTYAKIAQNPAIYRGQRIAVEGRVYNVNVEAGRSALQMLVRECPDGQRCPLWVSYHAATEFTVDSWVRVLGVVQGEQQFRSETDEIKVVPKVEATFLLPAKP
jgi:hypothetical protein